MIKIKGSPTFKAKLYKAMHFQTPNVSKMHRLALLKICWLMLSKECTLYQDVKLVYPIWLIFSSGRVTKILHSLNFMNSNPTFVSIFKNSQSTTKVHKFFFYFAGKNWVYIFSNFYRWVLHEDHSLRFMAASDSLPTECLERAGFHYRHDRVRRISLAAM